MKNNTEILNQIYDFLSDQEISDLFVTAAEGGVNYWCDEWPDCERNEECNSEFYSERLWQYIRSGKDMVFGDSESGGDYTKAMNLSDVLEGTMLMIKKYPKVYARIRNEEYDADDADVFFQLCLYKDIIFG